MRFSNFSEKKSNGSNMMTVLLMLTPANALGILESTYTVNSAFYTPVYAHSDIKIQTCKMILTKPYISL